MTKIRTVSDAKRDFYRRYNRPISSVYRRLVEELLVEMHLLVVNRDFRYDPIFALGVVTAFDKFMQGYQPAGDLGAILEALCQSISGGADQYRQDAAALKESLRGLTLEGVLNLETADNNLLLSTLNKTAETPNFKYSRLFAIGLYTALLELAPELAESAEQRQQTLTQLAEKLQLSGDKFQKDLDLYRSNLDKVDQLLKVLAESAEADRKKREKQAAEAGGA